ncbi:hypothetical protein [Ruminococcus sp. HUN007]|uniref:hypothetical protein n=1 Tax=Ruminococcus sp. HUN007 TaxID=1514668 RepID=UPI0005D2894D|nr:hypothetical protein [Ruminococcus sp. HUN007]
MSRIMIEDAGRKEFIFDNEITVVAAVKYTCDGETRWLLNNCSDGTSCFHESEENIFEYFSECESLAGQELMDFIKIVESTVTDNFFGFDFDDGDNDAIIEALSEVPEDDVTALLKYLMNLTVCDNDETDEIIEWGVGKYSDEIYEVDCDFSGMTAEEKFRYRLRLETDIAHDTVFHYINIDDYDRNKKILKKLVPEVDDDDYLIWKEKFFDEQLKLIDKEKIITCTYSFSGIGHYADVMHEDDYDVFLDFIAENGSAAMEGTRKATDDEVRLYIALNVDVA